MPSAKSNRTNANPTPRRSASNNPLEVVDPRWLVKALALSLGAAVICVYATLCLLVYQGRWQLVLHPGHTVDQTPASSGLNYTGVRFGATETGQPRLTGWWIPASSETGFQPKYTAFTVLYLHDGSGSLANTVPMLARLHRAGLNVFAIDYRGFGASDATAHPSDVRMAEDASDALTYLTSTRHIAAHNIVPYGVGLGASLAASLARAHPELSAVILDNPDPDPSATAAAAHPSHVIPVRLLANNQFDIATPISTLATPKLLIAGGPASPNSTRDSSHLQVLFQHAASPRFAVTLTPASKDGEYEAALDRFLDQYLPVP
jgi:pimeloyl-ACP methyl ester carboxylesterase